MANNKEKIPALQTQQWESFFDAQLPNAENSYGNNTIRKKPHCTNSGSQAPDVAVKPIPLPGYEHILAVDAVTFIDSPLRERLQRLPLSVRQVEKAIPGLLSKGLIKKVWLGKNLALAPTEKLYLLLGMDCPYKRNRWDVHSFLVLMAAKLIHVNPLVKCVKREVALNDNTMVDLISYAKMGDLWAWEITHRCTTNVAGHAGKLQGKGFAQIIFLCSDWNVREKTWAALRSAGFAPDFFATIRVTIFSALLRQKKQMILKDIR